MISSSSLGRSPNRSSDTVFVGTGPALLRPVMADCCDQRGESIGVELDEKHRGEQLPLA